MASKLAESSAPNGAVIELPGGLVPGGEVTEDANGVKRRRYLKDLARVGEFVKAGTGRRIKIDAGRIKHWAATAKEFIAAGNPVPMTATHDTTGDPDKSRGRLLDTFVEGDTLYGVIEAIGADAIQAASRSHVSIYSPPAFTDGEGKKWSWPIRHVALTTDPVLARQGDFVPIAASHDGDPAEVNILTPAESSTMDLKKLQKMLGIKDDLTDENAVEAISLAFTEAKKAAKPDAKLEAVTAERDELAGKADALKARVDELVAGAAELSHTERYAMRRSLKTELAALVKDSRITPAVADKIEELLAGRDIMLAVGEDDAEPLAMQIIDALKANDPVKLGEQTGMQVVRLAHTGKDDDGKPNEETNAAVAAMNKYAGAPAKKAG